VVSICCEGRRSCTSVYSALGSPIVPGHNRIPPTPDTRLRRRTRSRRASHGQAGDDACPVAHEIARVDVARFVPSSVHRDDPLFDGTLGFSFDVMRVARSRLCRYWATRHPHRPKLLPHDPLRRSADGEVRGVNGIVSPKESRTPGTRRPRFSVRCDPRRGLEVSPAITAARFRHLSYSAHPPSSCRSRSRRVEILDYVIVETACVLVNPMWWTANLWRLAQGIVTGVYEEIRSMSPGTAPATTLRTICYRGDRGPAPRLDHLETPSPYTQVRVKGSARARHRTAGAISTAVNDAFPSLGGRMMHSPITPLPCCRSDPRARDAESPRSETRAFGYERPPTAGALAVLGEAEGRRRSSPRVIARTDAQSAVGRADLIFDHLGLRN